LGKENYYNNMELMSEREVLLGKKRSFVTMGMFAFACSLYILYIYLLDWIE
jgi:hypothetical protein